MNVKFRYQLPLILWQERMSINTHIAIKGYIIVTQILESKVTTKKK